MGRHATLGNRLFPSGNALKYGHTLLHELVGLDVHQVCTGQAVLGDEDGLLVPIDVREELSRLAFEGSDEFGAHEVTLKYHSGPRKWLRDKCL